MGKKGVNFFILGIFCIFLILGMLILTSVSAPFSQEKFGNSFYYLKHQLFFGLIPGIIILLFFLKVELNSLKKYSFYLLLFNLILMLLVFVPNVGIKIRGGARWIGFGPFSFQPSEFLKLTFIIYLAAWLSSQTKTNQKRNFTQTFFIFLILMSVISLLLISQPDMSTLVIIFITSLVMFFLAKTPVWQSVLIALIFLILFFPLVKFAPYRLSRILVFLNPELDPLGIGYQIKQSLIAIGSGKIFGLGLGLSKQKLGVLPQSFSDSIFAIFAEETGFLGCLFLIFLYLIFSWRGFKIGNESQDTFERILVFGISFWIFIQAFINIGAMIGILPLTGTPLPFISYGGSHLIAELGGVGVLLNISSKK